MSHLTKYFMGSHLVMIFQCWSMATKSRILLREIWFWVLAVGSFSILISAYKSRRNAAFYSYMYRVCRIEGRDYSHLRYSHLYTGALHHDHWGYPGRIPLCKARNYEIGSTYPRGKLRINVTFLFLYSFRALILIVIGVGEKNGYFGPFLLQCHGTSWSQTMPMLPKRGYHQLILGFTGVHGSFYDA